MAFGGQHRKGVGYSCPLDERSFAETLSRNVSASSEASVETYEHKLALL